MPCTATACRSATGSTSTTTRAASRTCSNAAPRARSTTWAAGTPRTNMEIARQLIEALRPVVRAQLRHVTDRPGHDRRYALDANARALGWKPQSRLRRRHRRKRSPGIATTNPGGAHYANPAGAPSTRTYRAPPPVALLLARLTRRWPSVAGASNREASLVVQANGGAPCGNEESGARGAL